MTHTPDTSGNLPASPEQRDEVDVIVGAITSWFMTRKPMKRTMCRAIHLDEAYELAGRIASRLPRESVESSPTDEERERLAGIMDGLAVTAYVSPGDAKTRRVRQADYEAIAARLRSGGRQNEQALTGDELAKSWPACIAALMRRDVVKALTLAPFGYTSNMRGGLYEFTIEGGPLSGNQGIAPTLDDAVRFALVGAPVALLRAPSESPVVAGSGKLQALSEEQRAAIEEARKKFAAEMKPLTDAARASARLTGEDFALRVGAPKEPPALSDEQGIAQLLAKHRQTQQLWGQSACACGATFDSQAAWESHLASVLASGIHAQQEQGAIQEALRDLASRRCSDGYCDLAGPAKGMHTNGGCQCLREIRDPALRARLRQILRVLRESVLGESVAAPQQDKAAIQGEGQ